MMAEHPIIFSTEMVNAILDGRKTQTRRIVKARKLHSDYGEPLWDEAFVDGKPPEPYLHVPFNGGEMGGTVHRHYPKWEVGDTLWVRESILLTREQNTPYYDTLYATDNTHLDDLHELDDWFESYSCWYDSGKNKQIIPKHYGRI